ncbi:phosphoribosyltransferase [Listeria booriae]|uniref:phosphoribosyltransferase n=1 Tax=Listeria booriae TaxID=1552123 RepID=UPI001625AE5B|nr:phosphoribosyltransferase [Listeria booriae]MBC2258241.1 phosphoribosyltransferase [Listeria booriae]
MRQVAFILPKRFFFSNDNQIKEDAEKRFDFFLTQDIGIYILAQQHTISKLRPQVSDDYKDKINFVGRKEYDLIKGKKNDIIFIVVGLEHHDAIFSFQCFVMLIDGGCFLKNPDERGEKIITYGIPINKIEDLILYSKVLKIHKENYFHLGHGENYEVYSFNNANTLGFRVGAEEKKVKEIFQINLKANISNRDAKALMIIMLHLLGELSTSSNFSDIDIWGTFPSSNPDNQDTSVTFIKEAIRLIDGSKVNKEPLIRHTKRQKKQTSGKQYKYENKINDDFQTLRANPVIKDKIKGAVICIIDDYITTGYSAEAAKHILLEAGAKKVIFISVGKFGREYFSTEYNIEGDVYGDYAANFVSESDFNGRGYTDNDTEFLEFIGKIE